MLPLFLWILAFSFLNHQLLPSNKPFPSLCRLALCFVPIALLKLQSPWFKPSGTFSFSVVFLGVFLRAVFILCFDLPLSATHHSQSLPLGNTFFCFLTLCTPPTSLAILFLDSFH